MFRSEFAFGESLSMMWPFWDCKCLYILKVFCALQDTSFHWRFCQGVVGVSMCTIDYVCGSKSQC